MSKLRVWWISQIGTDTIYIPVQSVKEAKKTMDLLSYFDCFQYNQHIRPDYCNGGGLEKYDEETQEWCDEYRKLVEEVATKKQDIDKANQDKYERDNDNCEARYDTCYQAIKSRERFNRKKEEWESEPNPYHDSENAE